MIDVYGSDGCTGCKNTTRWLDTNGVEYQYHDVRRDSVALDTVVGLGYAGVPVIVTPSGSHWNGFNLGKLKDLLA